MAGVTERFMRRINYRYRKKKYAADILCFLLNSPKGRMPGMGEIIVCLEQVKRDAIKARVHWHIHLCRMLVHACLHLFGFHHDTAKARMRMEEKEKKLFTF